ncbi:hypothetical protein, partial [Bibersteinia trehalosi]|uniref:hypothetical protein n=1 Tax=Bibersteinia trehalosi TaxID=47735 RepID=UPI00163A01E7
SGYRRDDSSLSKYLASEYYRQNLSYEAKQGQSMATGIVSLPSVAYGYRFVPELGKFVLANPIKSETAMVVGYKSGELVGEGKVFVNGKFNQQGVEDIAKDGLKTLALGKLPWWQQSLYGTAIDYGYEVNKSNATPQSVK